MCIIADLKEKKVVFLAMFSFGPDTFPQKKMFNEVFLPFFSQASQLRVLIPSFSWCYTCDRIFPLGVSLCGYLFQRSVVTNFHAKEVPRGQNVSMRVGTGAFNHLRSRSFETYNLLLTAMILVNLSLGIFLAF